MSNRKNSEQDTEEKQDKILTKLVIELDSQTNENSMHIVLFMRGMVVSGTVISRREWLKACLEEVTIMTGKEVELPEFEMSPRTPKYVHLKNPRFSYPIPGYVEVEENMQPFVRVRLSSIDGWMLGTAKR